MHEERISLQMWKARPKQDQMHFPSLEECRCILRPCTQCFLPFGKCRRREYNIRISESVESKTKAKPNAFFRPRNMHSRGVRSSTSIVQSVFRSGVQTNQIKSKIEIAFCVSRPTTIPYAPRGMPNACFVARGLHLATASRGVTECRCPLKAAKRLFFPQ